MANIVRLLFASSLNVFIRFVLVSATSNSGACPIYLTLSLESKNVIDSSIELNWGPGCETPPKSVALFTSNPMLDVEQRPLAIVNTDGASEGVHLSTIKFGKNGEFLPGAWNRNSTGIRSSRSECLPFYVASFDDNGVHPVAVNCLKIRPTWMADPVIQALPLKRLLLPGTHFSGSYFNRSSLRAMALRKYGFNQNFDVWTQLVFGIRYLDISAGYIESNSTKKFWTIADGLVVTLIDRILTDVRDFVLSTEHEIVIVDFFEFPLGFFKHPERHDELVELIRQKLGSLVFERNNNDKEQHQSYDLTIEMMRAKGRRILVTYNQERVVRENPLVWNSWQRYSTSELRRDEITDYVRQVFSIKTSEGDSSAGWVLMGVQGLESSYDPNKKVLLARERAQHFNRQIIKWLTGPAGNLANVVAFDYFMATNLIDLVVYINQFKNTYAFVL